MNPAYFSEAARDFVKNGGAYTRAPAGTREFEEYWAEQDKRCMQGYSVGGVWIPGRYYDYLNFTPIMKVKESTFRAVMHEKKDRKGKMSKLDLEKVMEFPMFTELDFEWYNLKYIAWMGGKFRTSNQLVTSPGQKHIGCVKTRGAGFSYKEAHDGAYNFKHYPGSKSYYFAGVEQYLTKDGILNKVQPMLDFINDHCPIWRQNRMVRSTLMHQRASFLDKLGQERGTMSEILGQVVDDPNKTRGKRGRKITFEEAGSFKKLKQALAISLGSIRDGSIYIGQASVFGTGGEEGPGIEGLEDIFGQPEIYDMLEFMNVWDENATQESVGYFVPFYKADYPFILPNGKIDEESSRRENAVQRKKLEKAKDYRELDRFVAEYPENPGEALKRISGNPFNIQDIDRQIKLLQTDAELLGMLRYGRYKRLKDRVLFEVLPKHIAKPIEDYPHGRLSEEDMRGCVTVASAPWKDKDGHTPEGMYKVIIDPYAIEDAEDQTSLYVAVVMKQYNEYNNIDADLPHAWYEGRPAQLSEAYEQALALAIDYNAEMQGEITGGGQANVNYLRDRNFGWKLAKEPESIFNKEGKRAGTWMAMPTDRKRQGLTEVIDWTRRVRSIDDDGNVITTVGRLMWLGLLRELRKFKAKQNADRLSTMIIARLEAMDMEVVEEEGLTNTKDNDFWERQFKADQETAASGIIPLY